MYLNSKYIFQHMIIEDLTRLGLSEKEAKIYYMLLRIGPSPASSLARRVQIKRVTVYSVLESLKEKGLVSARKTEHGKIFLPHEPENLMIGFNERAAQLRMQMDLAKECIERIYSQCKKNIENTETSHCRCCLKSVQRSVIA